jgi:RNA polymerase sigma-70 factor (ECF subfamily)
MGYTRNSSFLPKKSHFPRSIGAEKGAMGIRKGGTLGMNLSQSGLDPRISQAREGDPQALGELLEQHRGYLKVLAQRILEGKLRARLDASDAVQKTCLEAQKAIKDFRGVTPAVFLVWLREIHEGNLLNLIREHFAQKRNVKRERAATAEEVDSIIADAVQSTPSQRVLRDENAVHLASALEKLPPDQREAVRLRYFEGQTIREVALAMDRSEKAAGALIMRGLAALRKLLGNFQSEG